ncbi:hypothetical protein GTPT_3370 [Tatumella ptyseos ATCC 33301]|uniref:Ubiquinone biosynthesis accessory factor UbiK n=2 Tax=Tatumella ptyseos TaxID=82987 RepID=A0A085J9E9_9GAMM|nr:hypothetical protein GTPT_3370 [Tatumella ptyseos ATCC 33301]
MLLIYGFPLTVEALHLILSGTATGGAETAFGRTLQETVMIDTKKIEQLARQVHDAMPQGIRTLGDDVEKKIRQVLQAQLGRMDLVNREEFDIQTQVLLRTREKLTALEQRLAALESQSTPDVPVVVADADAEDHKPSAAE